MVHWHGSLLLPLHLVYLVFLHTPSSELGSQSSFSCWHPLLLVFSHVSILSHTFGAKYVSHFFPWSCFSTQFFSLICHFYFMVYHMMCGFSLKNQDQDIGSPDLIFIDLFWVFVFDTSANHKRIIKEEGDPKGQFVNNICSTKLLSKQTESVYVLKSHWPV